ncbi:unnamed protein product, partial [Brassica oleracea var. botrytis]
MQIGQTEWVYDFLTPRQGRLRCNDKHLQLFSNLTRGNSAPLCLMSQAVLSSRGQRAFSIEKTWLWLFSRRAFFIPSNK